MNDFDRLLSESLKGAGESYSPRNAVAAREEFATRRRRRFVWQLSGGVALAGAAVAAALFFASAEPLRDESKPGPSRVASALAVVSRFGVGDDPIAIGGGDGVLWIANKADGSVDRIDLTTGEVKPIHLNGANEIAVGAAYAWVSGEEGDYSRIGTEPKARPENGDFVEENGGSQLIDIAVGGDAEGGVWAVDSDGCLWELTIPDEWYCAEPGFFPTDVATDEDEVWVLDSTRGYARQMNAEPGVNRGRPSDMYEGLPASEYGDITIAGDALWVSGGGRVERLDLATSERRSVQIEGDYADLAVAEPQADTVWALAGYADLDPRGRVYEIAEDMRVVGVSDELTDEPSDLVADADGVWVTIRETDEVIRIAREGGTAPPIETPQPEPTEAASEHGDVVMVFGKDGDIWAAYADGSIAPLTRTPNEEAFPVLIDSLDGTASGAVLFERGFEGGPPKLFHVDLSTMQESEIAEGYRPAAGSPGEQAWLGNSASIPWVVIADLFAEPTREVTIEGADGEPVQLSQLTWDAGGRFIYGLTTGRSPWPVSIDSVGEFEEVFPDPEPEVHVAAIATGGSDDSVSVVRICCSATFEPGSSHEVVELGEYYGWSSESGVRYRKLVDLSDLPWGPDLTRMTLARADGLSAAPRQEGVTWGPSDGPAWVVSDGVHGFLVDDQGAVQELPWEIHGGAYVNEDRNLQ